MNILLASLPFYTETLYPEWQQALQIDQVLFETRTEYQKLCIFQNSRFGKVLALDGVIQTTEQDAAIYAEMMVHVPFLAHGHVEKVLIVGGGDGSVLKEALRYPNLKKATLVELDGEIIALTRQFMPDICGSAFEDPRCDLHIQNAVDFIHSCTEKYDIVICDTTDPFGPGADLFTQEFYGHCKHCLNQDGILVNQNGVPFLQKEELALTYNNRKPHFAHVTFYLVAMPTYIGGHMALGFASDNPNLAYVSATILEKRIQNLEGDFLYYTPAMHRAAFALPHSLVKCGDHSLLGEHFSQILSGAIPPILNFSCPDSAEARTQIVNEIAHFYGAFLTKEIHAKESKERLRSHRMWLDQTPASSYPRRKQISAFIHTLKISMSEELKSESNTRLGMDYGPDTPSLAKAFEAAKLDNYFFKLLPYKSYLSLDSRQGTLTVRMDLSGPLF